MRGNRAVCIVKMLAIGIVAVIVFSGVTMLLWNWLMPGLFGLKMIGFAQALGLVILSKILFGGFRGGRRFGPGGPGGHWRRRMAERWEQMTPEEREKFRAGMKSGCCSFGPDAKSQA